MPRPQGRAWGRLSHPVRASGAEPEPLRPHQAVTLPVVGGPHGPCGPDGT